MPRSPVENLNQTGVDFLLTDLDTALVFLDIAATSRNQDNIKRNHQNARKAYDTVARLLLTVDPSPRQLSVITQKLGLLKSRLEAVGYTL
jgi:hypothetical protein